MVAIKTLMKLEQRINKELGFGFILKTDYLSKIIKLEDKVFYIRPKHHIENILLETKIYNKLTIEFLTFDEEIEIIIRNKTTEEIKEEQRIDNLPISEYFDYLLKNY
jgi:hypothetical protein